jgi:hypothetical protein
MLWFGQAVLNAACSTDLVEGVETMAGDLAVADARQVGELETVIGQHGVSLVRHRRRPSTTAISTSSTPRFFASLRRRPQEGYFELSDRLSKSGSAL